MAYTTANPPALIAQGIGGGHRVWSYKSTDAVADVDNTDYFTNALELGMQETDRVIVAETDAVVTTDTYVSDVDADGNGTVTQDA